MYWQPAHNEKKEHQSQGLGQLKLLSEIPLSITSGLSTAVELLSDQSENLPIQKNHYDQWDHHPAKEVKVHHVVQPNNIGEHADYLTGAAEIPTVEVIPADHRNQSTEEGEYPTQTDHHGCPPRGHYDAVPGNRINTT